MPARSLADVRLAITCERALRHNPMYEFLFMERRLFLASFMCDEIAYRRRTGFVLRDGPTVALVGRWPASAVPATELSRFTRRSLVRLPEVTRSRWTAENELNASLPDRPHLYLSAICTRARSQGHGHGERVMAQLAATGDGLGLEVYLATSAPWLVEWYRRLGYRPASNYKLGSTEVSVLVRPPRVP